MIIAESAVAFRLTPPPAALSTIEPSHERLRQRIEPRRLGGTIFQKSRTFGCLKQKPKVS
jgi:hypothetical protein